MVFYRNPCLGLGLYQLYTNLGEGLAGITVPSPVRPRDHGQVVRLRRVGNSVVVVQKVSLRRKLTEVWISQHAGFVLVFEDDCDNMLRAGASTLSLKRWYKVNKET
jgi:hypothetical protein